MGNLFYSIGIFTVIFNILMLFKYNKISKAINWLSEYKKLFGKNPKKEEYRNKSDQDLIGFWSFTVIFTVVWMIFGLMSKDWLIFLLIFFNNILLNLINYSISINKIKFLILILKSILMILIISFLIINFFHLGINTTEYLKSFLNH